jgi:hypothetical protein
MGQRNYIKTILEEKNGWKLGHNENPDVELPADQEVMLISPSGKKFSGDLDTMRKLLNDPSKEGFRKRYS